MSKIEVNEIDKQSGSTLTLGGSGTAVTLACGATQSGFGRSGSVNWQTGSIKTTTFTAADGEGYFVDTSSGAVTVNLPAGSAGAIVAFSDYTRTFGTNKLTIVPNGSNKIGGVAANAALTVDGQAATFVFVDATEGWINVQNAEDTESGATFITATGGTVTCSGDFKIHTFTGPGTFCVSALATSSENNKVDYLVVAGGGGGGTDVGGGGGAGGFRLSNDTCMPSPQTSPLACSTGITVTASAFPITVGAGGSVGPADGSGGSDSTFSTITSAGGGFGKGGTNGTGDPGGSGGGGKGAPSAPTSFPGGNGNVPSVSPPQGNNGGGGGDGQAHFTASGSGGGASAVGGDAVAPGSGTSPGFVNPGGAGGFVVSAGFAGCNGTSGPVPGARYFAGGGGGGLNTATPGAGGDGGAGGGGQGGQVNPSPRNATAGTANTGGGGGGDKNGPSGGAGGSGIVIIRYKFQ